MIPTSFDEANAVLGKPDSMSHEECTCLSVLRTEMDNGQPIVISCWKLTTEELAEIQRTGRVWLMIWGPTMPPAAVEGKRPF